MRVFQIAFLLAGMFFGPLALADGGVFEAVTGSVSISGRPVAKGDPFQSGIKIETGKDSNAVLRFDDGQVVALKEQTSFEVSEYRFNKQNNEGNSAFSLLKGGLRYVTGLLGKARPGSIKLITPVATIGVRGTDFMAVTGSLYLSVGQGLVSASSTAGTMTFAAGQIGFVSAAGVMPAAIAASQLPAAVAASFGQLGAIPVAGVGATSAAPGYGSGSAAGGGAAGGAAGASGASAAAVGGISAGTLAAGALAVGAIAASASSSSSTPGTAGTTGSTGTTGTR